MKEYIEQNPINSSTEEELVLWVCNYHNHINKINGKEEQDCEKVPVLWGRDECDCDEVVNLADQDTDDDSQESDQEENDETTEEVVEETTVEENTEEEVDK